MSTPLDQVNRNKSLGNCYYAALELIKDFPGLILDGMFSASSTANLVHGILQQRTKGIRHAWIEIDGRVYDLSNNQRIIVPASEYYEANDALVVRRFTRTEADALLTKGQLEDGSIQLGFWGDHSDEQIAAAISDYREDQGVFATDVRFSDPHDERNTVRPDTAPAAPSE